MCRSASEVRGGEAMQALLQEGHPVQLLTNFLTWFDGAGTATRCIDSIATTSAAAAAAVPALSASFASTAATATFW